MKLAALVLTTGALVMFAPAPSPAMPVDNLANAASSNVQDVRLVCRGGHCWRTHRRHVRRHFGPRYYYGSSWGYYPYAYYRPFRYRYYYQPAFAWSPGWSAWGWRRPAYAWSGWGWQRPVYAWSGWGWGRPGIGFGVWF